MEIYNIYKQKQESGFALIMALVVSSVILSIGLSMLSTTLKQVDLTATASQSEIAFQAASTAMDCALMTRIREGANMIPSPPANSINFDCGDITETAPTTAGGNYSLWSVSEDWVDASGAERWLTIDMYVVDASAGAETFTLPARDFSATCSDGSYCTYIFAEGYNRSQADIASGASFAVQRELTAEF